MGTTVGTTDGSSEGAGTTLVAGGAWIWPSLICEMGWMLAWGMAATTPASRATEAVEKRILTWFVWLVVEVYVKGEW